MWTDVIVEEIHRIREEYAESLNHDLNAIFEDLRRKEAESGRDVVTLTRKPGQATRWGGRPQYQNEESKDASQHLT